MSQARAFWRNNSSNGTDYAFFPNKPTPGPNAGGLPFQMKVSGVARPEPSTWALMLIGFGGLGLIRYCRRAVPASRAWRHFAFSWTASGWIISSWRAHSSNELRRLPTVRKISKTSPCAPPEGLPSGASNPSQRARPTGQIVRYLNRTYRVLATRGQQFIQRIRNKVKLAL
jgi:hypothetical protein